MLRALALPRAALCAAARAPGYVSARAVVHARVRGMASITPPPSRGYIENDPLPDRPPEDDIATCSAYFELLVSHLRTPEQAPDVMMRVARLKDPRNWVNVLNCFTVRRQHVPEVTAYLSQRFAASPGALEELPAHYLCSLAFALFAQRGGDAHLFRAIAQRARTLQQLPACDYDNLKRALEANGVDMPADVTRAADDA